MDYEVLIWANPALKYLYRVKIQAESFEAAKTMVQNSRIDDGFENAIQELEIVKTTSEPKAKMYRPDKPYLISKLGGEKKTVTASWTEIRRYEFPEEAPVEDEEALAEYVENHPEAEGDMDYFAIERETDDYTFEQGA
jgi:hypothetical protein